MNDELPSPPKLCRNKTTTPILQSLIRGFSLVALLPLNTWEGVCKTASAQRVCCFALFRIFFFFNFFLFLINVSKKGSCPTSGLNSNSSLWMQAKGKQKAPLFAGPIFSFGCLVCIPQTDPLLGERVRCWTVAEINQSKQELLHIIFPPPLLSHLWSKWEPILTQKMHKRGYGRWIPSYKLQTDCCWKE